MGIARTAARGVIFVALGNISLSVASFVASIVLARLLSPEHFGIIALASFFFLLFNRVREMGFDQGLINRKDLTPEIASTHYCIHLGLGVLIQALCLLSAPILWRIYGFEIAMALVILGFTGLLTSLSTTCTLLIDKELRFKRGAAIAAASSILTQIGMVGMAAAGFGLWSLVLGGIPAQLFNLVAVWRLSPVRPSLRFDRDIAKWFFSFGPWWHTLLSSTSSMITSWLDNFLVGTFGGMATLGYYSRAYNWSTLPTTTLTGVVSKVAYPTYAKLQDDRRRLSDAYSIVLSLIIRVSVPISLFAVLTIDLWTRLLIGEKWLPIVPVFQVLFVYMFCRTLFDDGANLLLAVGDTRMFNNIRIGQAIFFVLIAPGVTYLWGSIGAAATVSAITILSLLVLYRRLRQHIDLAYFQILGAPLLSGLAAFAATWLLLANWQDSELISSALASSVAFTGVYLVGLALLEGRSLARRASYFYALVRG